MRRGNLKDNEAGGGLGGGAAPPRPVHSLVGTEIPLLLLLLLLLPLLWQGPDLSRERGQPKNNEAGGGLEGRRCGLSALAGGLRFLCCCCCCCHCCCKERSCETRQPTKQRS